MNKDTDENVEVVAVEVDGEEPSRKSSWGHNLFYGTISAMIPIAMSFGLMSKLRDLLTWQDIIAIIVLMLIVVALVLLSLRQRFRERSYLRDWKARQERSKQRVHEPGHFAQEQRGGGASEPEDHMMDEEIDQASLENRVLRSLGVDPGR